jgi:hypothetical protein
MESWACGVGNHEGCQASRLAYLNYRKHTNFDYRMEAKRRVSLVEQCECGCHQPVAARPEPKVIERDYRPHGTVAGYRRHYRWGETPCDACREAQAEARAGYYHYVPKGVAK